LPLATHPNNKGWKDLFKTHLSNAEFPAKVRTSIKEVMIADETQIIF